MISCGFAENDDELKENFTRADDEYYSAYMNRMGLSIRKLHKTAMNAEAILYRLEYLRANAYKYVEQRKKTQLN